MGKKTKKNPGKKGGKREDTVKAEIQVNGDTIDLVQMKKAGVEINVLSNKENLAGNNNDDCGKKEFCISSKTVKELSSEEVDDKGNNADEKDVTMEAADESGFQDVNSSLLEKSGCSSSDLNQGFLEPSVRAPGPQAWTRKKNDTQQQRSGHNNRQATASPIRRMKGGPESGSNQQRHANLKSSLSSSRLEESSKHRQEAAVTDVTIEDYVRGGVPRYIAEMKHPLENTWTFWYQKNDPMVNWEAQMKAIVDVTTVEDFWQVYNYIEPVSNLNEGQDYSLFKKGIFPDWSDFQNMQGGRLIIDMKREEQDGRRSRGERLENMWIELLLILIGEQAKKNANQINGVIINVKKKADRLAVWLRNASDREGVVGVGRLVKTSLYLGDKVMYFKEHDQGQQGKNIRRNASSNSHNKMFI